MHQLDNASNQPPKFRTKNWFGIDNEARGRYNVNSQIKFQTKMLKSSLCDYSDAYTLFKVTITVADTSAAGAATNDTNKKVMFKICTPFTNFIIEINITQAEITLRILIL